MAVTKVHHLNCASIQGISLLGQHLVCHVLLVETSDAGLVLVDTGLGTADYADITSRLGFGFAYGYARPSRLPELAAIHQIRALGYDPSDVRHVVQTHLDLDHVGGLSDFPEAAVHVHGTELAMAMRRHGIKARGRYRPKMWAHDPHWETYTAPDRTWFGLDAIGGLRGLGDDFLLIPLFGHTHGHVGVALQHEGGWLLDAGDAYFDAREVKATRRCCGPGPALFQLVVTTEYRTRRDNQDRLRSLHRDHPEVELFAAHNPFEYFDLAVAGDDPVNGCSPTRRWRPENRARGSARS